MQCTLELGFRCKMSQAARPAPVRDLVHITKGFGFRDAAARMVPQVGTMFPRVALVVHPVLAVQVEQNVLIVQGVLVVEHIVQVLRPVQVVLGVVPIAHTIRLRADEGRAAIVLLAVPALCKAINIGSR